MSADLRTFHLCESAAGKQHHTEISRVCDFSSLICSIGVSPFCTSWFSFSLIPFHGWVSSRWKPSPAQIPSVVVRVPVSVWYLEIRTSIVSNLIWSSMLGSGLWGIWPHQAIITAHPQGIVSLKTLAFAINLFERETPYGDFWHKHLHQCRIAAVLHFLWWTLQHFTDR